MERSWVPNASCGRVWGLEVENLLELSESSRDVLRLLSLDRRSCDVTWELTGGGTLFLVAVPRVAVVAVVVVAVAARVVGVVVVVLLPGAR